MAARNLDAVRIRGENLRRGIPKITDQRPDDDAAEQ